MSTKTHTNKWIQRRLRPMRLRVRLRTALAGIAGLCVLLANQMNRVQQEQGAIAAMTSRGIRLAVASSAPDWLPEAFDGPWFQHVAGVNLVRGENTEGVESWGRHSREAPLSKIEIFFYVYPYRSVDVLERPPPIAEKWLPVVGAFGDCKVLLLGGSPIGDAGLKHLQRLSRLQYLDLSDTQITDEAVAELSQMESLTVLNLCGAKLSADGIQRLRCALRDCQIIE